MFTVKAVVDGEKPNGGHTEVMEAVLVTVRRAGDVHPTHHPDGREYVAPQFEVHVDGPDHSRIISVGSDRFAHYQCIYVMNDKGATVETVRAYPAPKALAA